MLCLRILMCAGGSACSAFARLFPTAGAAALAQERKLTDLERQGLIQAFEFTHELAWNTLKDFLESHGVLNLYGSKDATREAFAKGLIANGEAWMAMIQSRNRSSHTYNESTAKEVATAILSSYVSAVCRVSREVHRD